MGLDFVYGDVKDGVLRPLDGQQRLTTLFLLHWYVASLADELDPDAAWLRFSYATRPTARDFSERPRRAPVPRRSDDPVGVDHGPALVRLPVAARPDDRLDARDARRDPRAVRPCTHRRSMRSGVGSRNRRRTQRAGRSGSSSFPSSMRTSARTSTSR